MRFMKLVFDNPDEFVAFLSHAKEASIRFVFKKEVHEGDFTGYRTLFQDKGELGQAQCRIRGIKASEEVTKKLDEDIKKDYTLVNGICFVQMHEPPTPFRPPSGE